MLMKNTSHTPIKVDDLDLHVAVGGVVEVKDGYCKPRKAPNGAMMPSIIEMLAPQLVPADEKLVAQWKQRTVDLEEPKIPGPTQADFQAQGVPPAVAQLMADGNAERAAKAPPKAPTTSKPSTP